MNYQVNDKLLKILKKVYNKKRYEKDEKGYYREIDNGDVWDNERAVYIFSTNNLKDEEKTYLEESFYPLNEIEHFTHDKVIDEFKILTKNFNITMDKALQAYVAGMKSFPRGRQPILSYLYANQCKNHSYLSDTEYCQKCSVKKEKYLNVGEGLFSHYYGGSWNEGIELMLIELREFSQLEVPTPTEEDIAIFRKLIDIIRNAPQGETPGKLEQRIKSEKVFPKFSKYSVRGQLLSLAEFGIMPNDLYPPMVDRFVDTVEKMKLYEKAKGSPRSDIILPLAAWRGEYAIDEERLEKFFGKYSK
ncbi:hypothetical protein [Lysinibacillus sp. ZYM-1]|uniref:hypothetical protein n=1 Tax=Lysinibacillus sp. ZYM-1 TaxID=1681184 RepID=UPI000A5CCB6E|nr:hypothetical protein [Lysinibacillus sp. ZYM-1]